MVDIDLTSVPLIATLLLFYFDNEVCHIASSYALVIHQNHVELLLPPLPLQQTLVEKVYSQLYSAILSARVMRLINILYLPIFR